MAQLKQDHNNNLSLSIHKPIWNKEGAGPRLTFGHKLWQLTKEKLNNCRLFFTSLTTPVNFDTKWHHNDASVTFIHLLSCKHDRLSLTELLSVWVAVWWSWLSSERLHAGERTLTRTHRPRGHKPSRPISARLARRAGELCQPATKTPPPAVLCCMLL